MGKQAKVKAKYLRISDKKVHPWLDKLRGSSIDEARNYLMKLNNKPADLIESLLDSGISAAEDKDMDKDSLVIKNIVCQQGPAFKRQQIRSRGRADVIKKRTSHLVLTLKEKDGKERPAEKNKDKKRDGKEKKVKKNVKKKNKKKEKSKSKS